MNKNEIKPTEFYLCMHTGDIARGRDWLKFNHVDYTALTLITRKQK